MNIRQKILFYGLSVVFVLLLTVPDLSAQFRRNPTPNDTLKSVQILADNQLIFRIYAPKASAVAFSSSDMPAVGWQKPMEKAENGVWKIKIDSVDPGAYRYNFQVDGVSVIDPKNPKTSESNANTSSLVFVPGTGFMDMQDVPHGAVAEVTYFSKSLSKFRRMHVYTPPGYESGKGTYPVFYLLHGAFDCDDSWTTVGRAGFILDNLIAEGKAKSMIMVMPAGHTGPFRFGAPRDEATRDEFVVDFLEDIKPMVEARYRVRTGQENTAIAGLSMGGGHTLAITIPNLTDYAYFGVFSSGIFGITGGNGAFGSDGAKWEENNKAILDDPDLKKGLKLIWFATGSEDFLVETSRATVEALKRHEFDVVYKESEGGHTWINWREYLHEFAQKLFQWSQ